MKHTTALTTTTLLSLLAATTHSLSTQTIINNCPTALYLTNTDSNKTTTGPSAIDAGVNRTFPIIGTGNSLGVTKNDRFWTPETAKLIMGTSTDSGILYWTVSSVDGDPFVGQKWAVSSGEKNACDNTTT